MSNDGLLSGCLGLRG